MHQLRNTKLNEKHLLITVDGFISKRSNLIKETTVILYV